MVAPVVAAVVGVLWLLGMLLIAVLDSRLRGCRFKSKTARKSYGIVPSMNGVISAKAALRWYLTVCAVAYLDSLFQGNDGCRLYFQIVGHAE